ncbi:MAG: hypothetical protein LBI79_00915 [Nitrososphaerota archaeon]|nr:hypothetical protein [Nitrososphaerota archaeon]
MSLKGRLSRLERKLQEWYRSSVLPFSEKEHQLLHSCDVALVNSPG